MAMAVDGMMEDEIVVLDFYNSKRMTGRNTVKHKTLGYVEVFTQKMGGKHALYIYNIKKEIDR
jgi:hypothetical protein